MDSPSGATVKEPSFVFVWDSKTGSCTFKLIAATKPPLMSGASKFFLEKFGLNSLSDMPKLKEVSEIIESDPSLGEQITAFEDKNIKNKKISDNEVSDAVE